MPDAILSIQSHVAYGHVGNAAAVFPLQRLGFEVWPVLTVLFSNHTGYGSWRGRVVELAWVQEIIAGIAERGVLGRCGAVLSGYLGDPTSGRAVIEALTRVREERPEALWACDPVMGDVGRGFFVRPGIPEFFRDQALPLADILTPNQFELAWLANEAGDGAGIASLDEALAAAARVRARGPKLVACTSLMLPGWPDELGVLLDTADGSWLVRTPHLPVTLNGTGDVFTALFLGNWLLTRDPAATLERTVAAMYGLVEATWRAQSRELVLVAYQERIVDPQQRFSAVRLR